MIKFIEEFYYGRLQPQKRSGEPSEETKAEFEILENTEKYFCKTLTGDDNLRFSRYLIALNKVTDESNCDSFITGFRLGAAFALDAYFNGNTDFNVLFRENE